MIKFTECSESLPRDFALVVMQGRDFGCYIGSIYKGDWRIMVPLHNDDGKQILLTECGDPERWCYVFPQEEDTIPDIGSMQDCYDAFIEFFPWKRSTFPTYGKWLVSDDDCARSFRQGWAARNKTK